MKFIQLHSCANWALVRTKPPLRHERYVLLYQYSWTEVCQITKLYFESTPLHDLLLITLKPKIIYLSNWSQGTPPLLSATIHGSTYTTCCKHFHFYTSTFKKFLSAHTSTGYPQKTVQLPRSACGLLATHLPSISPQFFPRWPDNSWQSI